MKKENNSKTRIKKNLHYYFLKNGPSIMSKVIALKQIYTGE